MRANKRSTASRACLASQKRLPSRNPSGRPAHALAVPAGHESKDPRPTAELDVGVAAGGTPSPTVHMITSRVLEAPGPVTILSVADVHALATPRGTAARAGIDAVVLGDRDGQVRYQGTSEGRTTSNDGQQQSPCVAVSAGAPVRGWRDVASAVMAASVAVGCLLAYSCAVEGDGGSRITASPTRASARVRLVHQTLGVCRPLADGCDSLAPTWAQLSRGTTQPPGRRTEGRPA